MKSLNEQASTVFKKLCDTISNDKYKTGEDAAKINNSTAYMPVAVERVGTIVSHGPVVSVAHYGEQNGDLMADPEMTFTIIDGKVYPISYRNDYIGTYQEVLDVDDRGLPTNIDLDQQSKLVTYANDWMINIQMQQGL